MRDDEAAESLREDADADFDAAGGDDTSSPVLRRRPSTGCLGMGDCCEDEKLVRGCDGLVARLDEVDGGGGDRSLEEELGEKEEEEGDGEFDEVQGVEERANVGLERNIVHRCDSEQASERVGGLTDINGGEHEVLGVVEGSGHYEDSGAEAQTTSKMVDASAVVNCGTIDRTLAVELVDDGLHSDNENGEKLVVVQEIDEESQRVLRGEEQNVHVGSEQAVGVDCCQLQPTCANDDVADQSLAVDIAENGSGLGDLILGKKDEEEECSQSLGSKEENELLGLIQKIDMVAPEMAREEEHKKLADSSASSMLAGDCFGSSPCQKVGVPKDLNTHDSHQRLEVEITNTMVSVNCGSGSGESTSVIKEAEDENSKTLGIEQVIKHLDLKQAPSSEGVRKSVIEEEHDEFPGLSPLRTLGRADFGCSVFGIGSEVGFLSSGALGNDGVSHRCEDAELFVSSGSAASCPLVEVNRDASKTAERHHCPQGASQNCQLTYINERCEKSHCFGVEKVNSGHCSGKELLPSNGNGEELRFGVGQSLPLQCVGLEQEHCGDNIDGSHSICLQEIAGGREVNHAVQVLPVEDAPCTTAPGSALGEPPYLSSPIESFSSKLYLSPDFQGGTVDASVGMSVCCSNVNSSCLKADNGGRSDSKYSSPIVLRRSNPKRSASLRSNLADENYCQSSKTINNRRSRRKTVNIGLDFLLSKIKFSELKRKRSWPRRAACHSNWGPLENLIRNFDQNVNLANCDADKVQIQNKRSRKGRSTVGSKAQPKSQKDGKFLLPAAKHSAMSDHHGFHAVVGLPTSNCQLDFDKFTKVEDDNELGSDKLDVVKSLKQDEQLGEKDRDSSLTQEASGELGERSGVSSQIASEMLVETVSYKNSLDPGTSPDSDVYNPVIDVGIMTSEGNNSADQVIGNKDVGIITSEGAASTEQMGQNVLVQGAVSDDGLHPAVSTSSNACITSFSVPSLDSNLYAKAKNEKMKGQVREQSCLSDHLSALEKFHEPEILNNTKKPTKPTKPGKSKQKKQDFSNKKNRSCSRSHKKTNKKGSKCKSVAFKSSLPETAELQRPEEFMKAPNYLDNSVLPGEEASNLLPEASLHSSKTEGHKLSGGTKTGVNKGISYRRKTAGQKRESAERKKGNSVQKSDNKCDFSTEDRSQTVDASVEVSNNVSFSSGIVDATLTGSTQKNGGTNVGRRVVPQDITSLVMTAAGDPLISNEPESILEQTLPPQVAWVLCDDCEKWRCISVELANTLEETKGKWTCKDNTDKAFADCSIPQEKTNSEINAELGISDEEDPSSVKANANEVEPSKLADVATSGRASWSPIKSNIFLHRTRKTQTIDEIMVCHCKSMRDDHPGCGDQCLNRMLNIECVKGTCPCGDLCSNQRFQKRKYAKFKWFRCGKKGYGLQLREDVSQGQFLIEYVGEVLDLSTYEARQKDYASRGQKHFYFMTLNGGEVIDACAKGNLGRFINHSCEPNCRTEKWMVNGEVCIGLFAIRDIKKGEEVTFDYNYVRVVGAAAKKCVCGSSECRGYIGGDPLNSEVIVQGDSDEEDFEPVVVRKNSQRVVNLNDSLSNASDMKAAKHKDISVEREDIVVTCSSAVLEPQTGVLNEEDVCSSIPEVNPVNISLKSLDPMQLDNTISTLMSGIQALGDSELSSNSTQVEERICKSLTDIQPQEISLQASSTVNEVPSNYVLNSKKSTTNPFEEKPNTTKPNSVKKSSHSRGTIKRGRSNMKHPVSDKTKTSTIGTGGCHFQGVEEKLNELLDVDGGISKQKDATRGYLKLLFVTAAGGDVRGCASQSTRDLSLILDAVLKTKSRKVLVDIINKNGLQMLHNIMKQNRGNFTRIPIIRKLLKVFEFLALAGILTLELINKPPPCTGMESFKESILKLANHEDKLVHKIAREFRDKWIPRHIRRVEPSDRDDSKLDRQVPYHPWIQSPKLKRQQVSRERDTDAIVISAPDPSPTSSNKVDTHGEASSHSQQLSINVPLSDNSSARGTKVRKRKSRWDTPSDVTSAGLQYLETSSKFMKCTLALSEQTSSLEVSKHKYGAERGDNRTCCEVGSSQDLMQLDDERPPGFAGFANDEGPPGFLSNDEGPPGFLDDGPPGFLDEGPPGFVDAEGPPGFEPHQKNHHSPFSSEAALITGEVFTGHPQEIYLSQMTVSFGMPVALMQQLGTPETGGSQTNQNWAVAPGMPFYPYPPLPSYPRGQPNPRQKRRRVHQTNDTIPSTSGEAPDMTETGFRNSQFNGRLRWPNKGYGRKFPRQQRWNDNPRFQRFWPHQKFGRGFRGNMRNGPHILEAGNVRSDLRGGLRPPDSVSNNGGFCSNFHKPHN